MIALFRELLQVVSSARGGAKDVAVTMVPRVIAIFTGFFTAILLARGLGATEYGKYSLIMTFCGLCLEISELGIGYTTIRFASRFAGDGNTPKLLSVLRWSFRMRLTVVIAICTVAYFLAPTVVNWLWHVGEILSIIRISLLSVIFGAVASIPIMYYQSIKDFKTNAIVSSAQTLIQFLGVFFLYIVAFWSLDSAVYAFLIAGAAGAAIFVFKVPRGSFVKISEFQSGDFHFFRPAIAEQDTGKKGEFQSFAIYMLVSALVVTLMVKLDVWFLGHYVSKADVGAYNIGLKFTLPLMVLFNALSTVLLPKASAIDKIDLLTAFLKKTFTSCLLVGLLGIIYAVAMPQITPYVFGQQYSAATMVGVLLCLRYCFAIVFCPVYIVGYSIGMVSVYWWINIIQLVVVVALNLALIPLIGVIASPIALISCDITGIAITYPLLARRIAQKRLESVNE
jgi:O-antigen/teichoic acid export membrane protein